MEADLRAFVNYKQNDWARLLPMAEYAYNNAQNTSTGYTPFELNCGFYPRVSYEEDIDPRSRSKTADQLPIELPTLMSVCRENLQHAQELQNCYHDKHAKPKSYTPGDKVWLNNKYIKTKRNRKLEFKFLGSFRRLHPVGKHAYKLELPKRCRIYDVFYMSLLEQITTRKGRVDENTLQLEFEDDGKGEEYKLEAICDSKVYARESESGPLLGLYYLISCKDYPEEENTWEPASAIQHLRRLVSTFRKKHPDKLTATSPPVDLGPPIAKPTIRPEDRNNKRKRGRPAKVSSTRKRSKN